MKKRCEICEAEEHSDDPGSPQVRLVTVRERICCESCILLGIDSLRHWEGEHEKDGSEQVTIGCHTLCESHIIMGID